MPVKQKLWWYHKKTKAWNRWQRNRISIILQIFWNHNRKDRELNREINEKSIEVRTIFNEMGTMMTERYWQKETKLR